MIVAVPPGGPADILARLVGPRLTESLGQTVVIDNRPGANGNIAYEMAARAAPDGYTFVLVAAGVAINPSLYREVRYDPLRDFAAITLGISVPNILIVHPSVPAASVPELIALAKSRAGPAHVRFGRQRHVRPPGAGAVQAARRHGRGPRAVQGRRAGACGSGRRPGAGAVQPRARRDAADQGRPGAGARDHQRQALGGRAGAADGGGARLSRLRGDRLVRLARAGEDAARRSSRA